jgi:hypothetical protein
MRLPEKESTWQLVIGLLVGFAGMVALLIAEVKHRQSLEMLKEVKTLEQTIKEVCHE